MVHLGHQVYSIEEARRQVLHIGIKSLQETIKEKEEKIDVLLVWGRPNHKDPELIEKQRMDMERRRREDPVIINLQSQIDECKKAIAKMEEDLSSSSASAEQ